MLSADNSMNDPLDLGRHPEKTWQEFRVTFAAARLTSWIVTDLGRIAPVFGEGLQSALDKALWDAEDRRERNADYDWAELEVPGGVTLVTDVSEIEELRDQLLPSTGGPSDVPAHARGLAWVGLHSATERLAKDLGVASIKGGWVQTGLNSLPDQIGYFMEQRGRPLTGEQLNALRIFDEVRHLVVHHRGITTPRYLKNVARATHVLGEFRVITARELWEAGDLAWFTARALYAIA